MRKTVTIRGKRIRYDYYERTQNYLVPHFISWYVRDAHGPSLVHSEPDSYLSPAARRFHGSVATGVASAFLAFIFYPHKMIEASANLARADRFANANPEIFWICAAVAACTIPVALVSLPETLRAWRAGIAQMSRLMFLLIAAFFGPFFFGLFFIEVVARL